MPAGTVEPALIMGASAMLVTGLAMIGRIQHPLIQGVGPHDRRVALVYCFSLALLVGGVGVTLCRHAHSASLTTMAWGLP